MKITFILRLRSRACVCTFVSRFSLHDSADVAIVKCNHIQCIVMQNQTIKLSSSVSFFLAVLLATLKYQRVLYLTRFWYARFGFRNAIRIH